MKGWHGGELNKIAKQFGLKICELTDFSTNVNVFGPPPDLLGIINKHFEQITKYPDSNSKDLVSAIARHENVDPENIIVGNGSIELIYLLPRIFEMPPEALILAPTFSEYENAIDNVRGKNRHINIYGKEDNLSRTIDIAANSDIVFLCNPNNPTGRLYHKDALEKLIDSSEQDNFYICIDESFIEFVLNGKKHTLVKKAANSSRLIIVKSMTKLFSIPGLRLGYAVANNELINQMYKYKEPWSVNLFAQKIGEHLLNNTNFIQNTIVETEKVKNHFMKSFPKNQRVKAIAGDANFIFFECDFQETALELWNDAASQGIVFRDCSNFTHCPPGLRMGLKNMGTNNIALEFFWKYLT